MTPSITRRTARGPQHNRARGIFGQALFEARTRARLSQADVARLFGRHRVTIARYEAGDLVPHGTWIRQKLAILDRMAQA